MQKDCTATIYICPKSYVIMELFKNILEKRHLDKCPLPLWKLKLSDDEYRQLKELLKQKTRSTQLENPFILVCREVALYFAEFWRREYYDGSHSKQLVYDSLEATGRIDYSDEFYDAACRGAKFLHIELYKGGTNNRTDFMNSILYQGGLPMKLVTEGKVNSVWDRFVRGLINKKINFDDLDLGLVAANNTSLKEYCEQLITGIEADHFMLMPFHAENEFDSWYIFLQDLAKQEKKRQRLLRPFSLDWEFRIDSIEKRIFTKFIVNGGQRLPDAFLEDCGLLDMKSFTVQIQVNGKISDTFDYVHNFCRYAVVSKHPYYNGDKVSLFIDTRTEPHISGDLDMSVPHIMYRNKEGKYVLGNQIGKQDSFLLIPSSWKVSDDCILEQESYSWDTETYIGIRIPYDFQEDIKVESQDGVITLGPNSALYWTELTSTPLYIPDVQESLYDASHSRFTLCYDSEDGTRSSHSNNIEYRNKWQTEWSNDPSYGEIYARVKDSNGNFITPTKFINIGTGLTINVISSNESYCHLKVTWPHGRVSTDEGVRKANDIWLINKSDITNNRIRFTLIPNENSHNQFVVTVRAPFKEFYINNIDDNRVDSDSWIPYADIDKYQYHLVGQDIREYTFGNCRRELRWICDKLYVIENGKKLRTIPYEGSLMYLFDSREVIRTILERTSQNMLKAEVEISFTTSSGSKLRFGIKKSPFRPKQQEDGRVVITSKYKKPIDFRGALKLLKLDDPTHEPILLQYDDTRGYILPQEIMSWGKTLLVGRARGRICPTLVDLTRNMSGEDRLNTRDSAIQTINCLISESQLGNDFWQRTINWFATIQNEDIPAASLLELYCISNNQEALLCLAFQLFAQCDSDERDTLTEQLKSMSNDLAFSWYWLRPYLDTIMLIIQKYLQGFDNPVIRKIYIKWAMQQGEQAITYLSVLNDSDKYAEHAITCLMQVLSTFQNWMKDLCLTSLLETYDGDVTEETEFLASDLIENPKSVSRYDKSSEDFVEVNQDYINDSTSLFFLNFNEPGTVGNENWMFKRVNAVVAHLSKKVNLFEQSDEIRRSIIFCSKSCNRQFIISITNKLAKLKYEIH